MDAYLRHPPDDGAVMVDHDDPTVAIVAHGLLSSLGVITGAAVTIRSRLNDLSEEAVASLCTAIVEHASLVSGVLGDLARGLPAEALDPLSRE